MPANKNIACQKVTLSMSTMKDSAPAADIGDAKQIALTAADLVRIIKPLMLAAVGKEKVRKDARQYLKLVRVDSKWSVDKEYESVGEAQKAEKNEKGDSLSNGQIHKWACAFPRPNRMGDVWVIQAETENDIEAYINEAWISEQLQKELARRVKRDERRVVAGEMANKKVENDPEVEALRQQFKQYWERIRGSGRKRKGSRSVARLVKEGGAWKMKIYDSSSSAAAQNSTRSGTISYWIGRGDKTNSRGELWLGEPSMEHRCGNRISAKRRKAKGGAALAIRQTMEVRRMRERHRAEEKAMAERHEAERVAEAARAAAEMDS